VGIIIPYDKCVANKMIEGSQCTVTWHVDDLKISHKSREVLKILYEMIDAEYRHQVEMGGSSR